MTKKQAREIFFLVVTFLFGRRRHQLLWPLPLLRRQSEENRSQMSGDTRISKLQIELYTAAMQHSPSIRPTSLNPWLLSEKTQKSLLNELSRMYFDSFLTKTRTKKGVEHLELWANHDNSSRSSTGELGFPPSIPYGLYSGSHIVLQRNYLDALPNRER